MSHGGDGSHKTFRIDWALMINMVITKEIQIDLGQDIHAGILGIAMTVNQDSCVDDQQADHYGDGVLMIAEEREERHDAIADGDALHDSPDTEMSEAKQVTFYRMVKPVDKEADDEKQHRALHDTTDDLRCRFELRLHQRQVTRNTHDEQEERKHEVARRHTVPLGMS